MEVSGGELVPMASTDFHTQFFQNAELMGGEMELGFSNVMSPQDLFIHHNNSSPSSSSLSSIESPSLVFNANPIATSIHSFRPPQLLSLESQQAEMTRAILAVLSSSPNQPQNPKASNFKKYSSTSQSQMIMGMGRPSMFKRSIMYYRNLNQATLSSTSKTQLQHMISERRRRHKQNHNFQTLRSLLPPGSKKDKASVLTSTREYLSLLRDEVAELSQRNQILEAQLRQDCSSSSSIEEDNNNGSSSNVEVGMRRISGTQQGLSTVEVRVSVRGECSAVELLIRLLHLFKMDLNHFIALLSIQAKRLINRLNLILQIQVSEWDESALGEAVEGVINDLLSSKSNQYV